MSSPVPYDAFADIYDAWCESAPITRENRELYLKLLSESPGPRVELGVGNGRICVEVAKRGKRIVGVDSSHAMLELCRQRAAEAGVGEALTLVEADFRDFVLPEPADLVTLPFHSIGHLLTDADKLRAMQQVRSQLRVGGRFVFDHFIFDPDYPQPPGIPQLRAELTDPDSGRDVFLWEATTRDLERQRLHIVAVTDAIDADGHVVSRRYRRSDLSWLSPEQSRSLIERAGLEVEAVYGDFHGGPLTASSTHQIWVTRKDA
jgi:SAM-dependent methyltransferase